MKGIYILGISSILLLTACSDKANEQPIGKEIEDNQNINMEGITIGYEYKWDNIERDLFSLDSQLNEEDYSNIKTFFNTFTLPEEGRLTPEDAKEYFPQDVESNSSYNFSDDEVYYKNYLVFDTNTNMALSTNIWGYDSNTFDPIKPFETQAVGLFMSIIEEINDRGYLSPTGEIVSEYTTLSTEEKKYLDDELFHATQQEGNKLPKGWGALQGVIDSIQLKLEYIEPYLKEYQELHTWSAETRQYLQVANSIGYQDYERAYQYIVAATINIDRMSQVLPGD
ncbi:hypothetical protein [Lederbergia lenta]|uniref:Lipoprotein n=1 Tax=Lederbergia lenta TaxID=1467 RepID=A0A2X4WII4_LEDLE|nr:hypothetical protein [Lederbergia lenta]MEC2323083.1 hypothetical protein [Lederbergia lenta]SQI62679.1 Uncharacterised protein [Lederbergia lenta]